MANNVAAKRYAKALFALSTEQKAVDAVHEDLGGLVDLMEHSAEWSSFVRAPFGALEKREQLLANVLSNRTHALTSRFLSFIDRRRRIQLLPEIYQAWLALHDESKSILRAHATSAIPLTEKHEQSLVSRLGSRFDKKIILTTDIDETMIGGLKVFIGDHVFDYSVESQLQDLQKEMLRA